MMRINYTACMWMVFHNFSETSHVSTVGKQLVLLYNETEELWTSYLIPTLPTFSSSGVFYLQCWRLPLQERDYWKSVPFSASCWRDMQSIICHLIGGRCSCLA